MDHPVQKGSVMQILAPSVVAAALCLGGAGIAFAEGVSGEGERSGLYLDLYGGVDWIGKNALDTGTSADGPVLQTFFLDYDEGFVTGVRFGYRFAPRLRGDLEVALRESSIGALTSPGNIITPGYSFSFRTQAVMANAYYDFDRVGGFTPYVGAGIGKASVETVGSIAPGDPAFDYSATQTVTAGQLRIGAVYALSESMDLGVEYTHFRAFGIDENLSADFFDTLREDYQSNSVSVVLRMNF